MNRDIFLFMMDIIDIHSHIGDILHLEGGSIIPRKSLTDRNLFDTGFKLRNLADAGFYAALIKYETYGGRLPPLISRWKTYSGQMRNSSATYEHFNASMDRSKVTFACCLPIAPFVTFDDIKAISDDRIIPFSSVDFSGCQEIGRSLEEQVESGAKGLKLHPIIQRVSLTDARTREAVEAFGGYGFPVLFHCGVTGYYLGAEACRKERPEFGNVDDARSLISSYPSIPFIVGHAGILQVGEVIEKIPCLDNAFVDASFQSPASVRNLIKAFGSSRVMYASDWPYGDRTVSIRIMKEACCGDEVLMRKVFYENAAGLLKIK